MKRLDCGKRVMIAWPYKTSTLTIMIHALQLPWIMMDDIRLQVKSTCVIEC